MVTSDLRERLQSTLGPAYQIEREIGSGGMAHVYVAQDTLLRRTVVIKVLSPELAGSVDADRFRRETQILAQLHHPRIVPVLGAGQSGTLLYYTMPFIAGESLRATLHRERQLPLETALRYATDVADALTYAHQHNVVHRDIKPDNVMIDEGRALVTDFGISRAIERASDIDSVTSTGLTVGTPKYMSPEQAAADRYIDGRSDIYSLACVLYEMLVGEPPFPGTNSRLVLARHLQTAAPSARVGRPDLPEHVDRALLKALAKTAADRFATPQEFVEALKAGPMGAVHRSSMAAAPRRLRARLRARLAIAGVAAVMLAAVIALAIRPRGAGVDILELDPSRIAVTYFDAHAADTLLVAIARGVTRELIYALEGVPGLHVVSERGVRPFTPDVPVDSVARALQVGTVITGTVERLRDSIRIDVRLIEAPTGDERGRVRSVYPAALVLDLRDTIVGMVARQLRPEIGRAVRAHEWKSATRSATAWQLRQRAQELVDAERTMSSTRGAAGRLALLARADSLLALAGRADPGWYEPLEERGWLRATTSRVQSGKAASASIDSGIAFANTILQRAPGHATALALRGHLRYVRWSTVGSDAALLDSAATDLQAATLANPASARAWNSLSVVLRMQGDLRGAAEAVRRAIDSDAYLEEASPSMTRLIFQYLFATEYDSARALCAEAIRRFPRDANVAQCELNVIGWSGRGPADLARVWTLVETIERSGAWGLSGGLTPEARYYAAAVLARSGLKDSARAVVQDTRRRLIEAGKPNASLIGEAHVLLLLGDRSASLDRLEAAVRADAMSRDHMARLPWFAALRQDPRYRALLKH